MIDFTVLDKAIRSFMEQSRISFSYSFAGEHNEKRLSRAQKIFANNVDASQVYLQIDATISDSGRSGCVYTYNEVFIKDTGERCTISYHEIKGLTFIGKYNFIVSYRDGSAVKVFAPCSPVEVVSVLWAFASYYALSEHPEDPTVTTSYAVSPTLTCVFDSVIPSPALQTPQSKNENTDTSKSFQSVDSATNKQSIQRGQNVEPIQEISACNETVDKIICTNCGAVLQDGYAFCIKCGNPVNATQSIPISRQDNAISPSVNNSVPIQNNSIEKSISQQNSTSPASFCTNCGAVLQDGYAFCIKCGKPVCAVQNTTEQAQGMPFNPPAATQPVLDLHPRCSFEYIPIKTDIPAGTASYSGNTPKMIDFCCTGDDIAYIRDRLSSFSLSTAYTDELPPKKLMSALRYMAPGLPAMKVVGFVDTTLFGSCKEGILISPDFFFLRKGDEKFSIDFKMIET